MDAEHPAAAQPVPVPRPTRRAAYAAFGWVAVFFGFHVYWYAGGTFGLGGPLPGSADSVGGVIVELVVIAAFPIGALVCMAAARGWARGGLRRVVAAVVWFGFALLILRGGAGVLDDVTRVSGLLPNGITGLTLEQVMGTAHPSAALLCSGYATDGYFLAGGLLFGVLALRLRHLRAGDQGASVPATTTASSRCT